MGNCCAAVATEDVPPGQFEGHKRTNDDDGGGTDLSPVPLDDCDTFEGSSIVHTASPTGTTGGVIGGSPSQRTPTRRPHRPTVSIIPTGSDGIMITSPRSSADPASGQPPLSPPPPPPTATTTTNKQRLLMMMTSSSSMDSNLRQSGSLDNNLSGSFSNTNNFYFTNAHEKMLTPKSKGVAHGTTPLIRSAILGSPDAAAAQQVTPPNALRALDQQQRGNAELQTQQSPGSSNRDRSSFALPSSLRGPGGSSLNEPRRISDAMRSQQRIGVSPHSASLHDEQQQQQLDGSGFLRESSNTMSMSTLDATVGGGGGGGGIVNPSQLCNGVESSKLAGSLTSCKFEGSYSSPPCGVVGNRKRHGSRPVEFASVLGPEELAVASSSVRQNSLRMSSSANRAPPPLGHIRMQSGGDSDGAALSPRSVTTSSQAQFMRSGGNWVPLTATAQTNDGQSRPFSPLHVAAAPHRQQGTTPVASSSPFDRVLAGSRSAQSPRNATVSSPWAVGFDRQHSKASITGVSLAMANSVQDFGELVDEVDVETCSTVTE